MIFGTDHLVTIAVGEVGVREATGKNDGVPSERYQRDPYKPGVVRTVAWCALFVMWLFDQVPGGSRLHHTRPQWWDYAEVRALYLAWRHCSIPREIVQPGDVLILNERGDSDPGPGWHCGLVVLVTETHIVTVDGNVSNAVDFRVRDRADGRIIAVLRVL